MTVIDIFQASVAFIALALQIAATFMARPLRKMTPPNLWRVLMLLNGFIMLRRVLSVAEVVYKWQTERYESVTVVVGLGVSIWMLATVVLLRRYAYNERERLKTVAQNLKDVSAAAVNELVHVAQVHKDYKVEDSLAYKLAVHFIEQREKNGNGT